MLGAPPSQLETTRIHMASVNAGLHARVLFVPSPLLRFWQLGPFPHLVCRDSGAWAFYGKLIRDQGVAFTPYRSDIISAQQI